ncbi:TOMM precursor leader peptide-binding protein [Fodinicola acaciae]|uniref:TOMM precursor leader peptide-binding protein n=1 Tax=Fodinicola acaciae TaxID=2681555 RepID=UPI0013D72261|nr:TOMM precursor leader peptide-binding protein [Fodinicola acaciae]
MIRIVADGGFGAATAKELTALLGPEATAVTASWHEPGPDVLRGAAFAFFCSWRDVPADLDAFAALAGDACPWLPIVHSHPYVRIGPLAAPGGAPCQRCYQVRLAQHGHLRDAGQAELIELLSSRPDLGIDGFPPHIPLLAAGIGLGIMTRSAAADEVTLVNTATDVVRHWKVVPVHGCADCHHSGPANTRERVRGLRAALADSPVEAGKP